MKINRLILKNFKRIKTGMETNSIEINFDNSNNKIILLSGPNGSGKTTILENLHPFASNNNIDSRTGTPIIEGEDGYKEIEIVDGDDVYIIKHFYAINKDTHSLKSYISLNGKELNINGNVRSFNTIVQEYLDIEVDFLKLLRLGNNVTNFIDLSPTERKSFMGKLMSEIDLYMEYYKKINEKIKYYNIQLTSVNSKINRLNISDADYLKTQISDCGKMLNDKEIHVMKLTEELAVVNNNILSIGDIGEITNDLKSYQTEYVSLGKLLSNNKFHDIQNTSLNDLEIEIIRVSESIETLKRQQSDSVNRLDNLLTEKRHIEVELSKIDNENELNSLYSVKKSYEDTVKYWQDIFKDIKISYSTNDIRNIMETLREVQNILTTTYEFGQRVIGKVIKHIKKKDISEFITTGVKSIGNKKLYNASNRLLDVIYSKFPIIYPNCDDKKCPLYSFWMEFHDIASNIPDDSSDESEEFYSFMSLANNNITKALSLLNDKSDNFNNMPNEFKQEFLMDNILTKISECEWIYSVEFVNSYLTSVTDYNLYIEAKDRVVETDIEIKLIKEKSTRGYFDKRFKDVISEIADIEASMSNYIHNLKSLEADLDKLTVHKDLIINYQSYLLRNDDLDKLITTSKNLIGSYHELSNTCTTTSDYLTIEKLELRNLRDSLSNMEYRLRDFKSLRKELDVISNNYDECIQIRRSLSSKEGIPLYLIKLYLNESVSTTNELLRIAYDGELYIDDFNISPTEFNIPYIKNNTIIQDVSYSSQGETGFITVALSFALASKGLTKYNIMLLDEIDATLDSSNRKKFIEILEHQMDVINSEQIFLISHNDMFDIYPVDIVYTGDVKQKMNTLGINIKINKDV